MTYEVDEFEDLQSESNLPMKDAYKFYTKFRESLLYKNDEWIDLAFRLLIGKLINDYRLLLEEMKTKKSERSSLIFPHKVGELFVKFSERRQKDTKKNELSLNTKLNISRNKIIQHLVDYFEIIEKNFEIKYGKRYFRYCCQFYENWDLDTLDYDLPYTFYIELGAKINSTIRNYKKAKKFQREIVKLRKRIQFSNYHLRVVWNLVKEDIENRLDLDYIENSLKMILKIPAGLKMKEAKRKAKEILGIE